MVTTFLDAWDDLVLGSRCVGCERPGRVLCGPCAETLHGPPYAVTAPHLRGPAWVAGPYAGTLRSAVVAHKEDGVLGVAPALGRALAAAVGTGCGDRPDRAEPVVLVPVPSRPGVARRRGDDPLARVVSIARRTLAREGWSVQSVPLLRSHRGVLDQGGLGAVARAENLAGSLWCPDERLRRLARLAGRAPGARVVLCDDVVTTGATLGEAERALAAVGVRVHVRAVVAAVRLRHGARDARDTGPEAEFSGPA